MMEENICYIYIHIYIKIYIYIYIGWGLISKIYKDPIQLDREKTNTIKGQGN